MNKERGEGQEREPLHVILTEEQENRIADKVKVLVWRDFYFEFGKIAARVVLLVVGTGTLLWLATLAVQGKIKLPL